MRQSSYLMLKGLYKLMITRRNYLLFRVILNLFLIRPHTLKTGQTVKTQDFPCLKVECFYPA